MILLPLLFFFNLHQMSRLPFLSVPCFVLVFVLLLWRPLVEPVGITTWQRKGTELLKN